ncbi:MAG: hypothetical protein RLZZ211_1180 [Bacteroidota bacterium]|jgi:hypothetical protein
MKKSVLILLAIIVSITFSCSKDAKINRQIEGEWNVVTLAGDPVPVGESYVFKFNKDKKLSGDGTLTENWGTGSYVTPFTYSVSDEKIICILDGYSEVLSVLTIEKDKLELIDSDNAIWVLEPK